MIKVSVSKAAQMMNKGQQFVRIALQRGLVPFGFAVKLDEDSKKYDYYINPAQFCEYLGITEDELLAATKENKTSEVVQNAEPLFE